MRRPVGWFVYACLALVCLIASATATTINIPDVDPGIEPGHPLYWLDIIADELKVKCYECLRFLRLVSDDTVADVYLDILAERKAECKWLEERYNLTHDEKCLKLLKKVRKEYRHKMQLYDTYVKNKLEIRYTIKDGILTITVKNVWDRDIGYVTGHIKVVNLDTGEKTEYNSHIPFPLNLKPGESKTYTYDISELGYTGRYWIRLEIYEWTGMKLYKGEFEVSL